MFCLIGKHIYIPVTKKTVAVKPIKMESSFNGSKDIFLKIICCGKNYLNECFFLILRVTFKIKLDSLV
jgi:hypothetical protein